MSRCYPFPPPGYVGKECLIESIKGSKEEVKKDRKHKKKEKKRKERDNESGRSKKHRHKRQRKVDDEVANVDDHCKLINSENELLEKSCLTVELELQTSSQNSCDSTLHSYERPKQSQPLDGRHNDSGKKDLEAELMLMTNKDQKRREWLNASKGYSISANEASRDAVRVCQEKRRDPVFDSREIETKLSKEKMASVSSSSSSHQETIGTSKLLCKKCPPSMAVQFLNLIENWTPDRFESKLTNSEDQEWWLFMNFGTKRHQVCNQNIGHGSSSSTLWPTARFLPEAEVHALPFTVPF